MIDRMLLCDSFVPSTCNLKHAAMLVMSFALMGPVWSLNLKKGPNVVGETQGAKATKF